MRKSELKIGRKVVSCLVGAEDFGKGVITSIDEENETAMVRFPESPDPTAEYCHLYNEMDSRY